MACKNVCKVCDKLRFSQSVTVVTVDGTDTLVIDLPAGNYGNGCKYCIVITQNIPATATILMPVAISIGGVTTTVYPLTQSNCTQVTACGIRTRTRYSTRVHTTSTGGVFRLCGCDLNCYPQNNLASLPVTTAPAVTEAEAAALRSSRAVTKTVTTKTVLKAD